ncbi:hypothetical protein LIER_33068 [Lithospermum erythrorhizon]|uniref:Response regulatory domain-containing protein n=1 Tax=Lithospermum erythrorhizon TaxID=34254 RepID=A0AAV3RZ25_LITER
MAHKAKEEGAIAFFKKPMSYHSLINIWEFAPRKILNENQCISESQPKQATELLEFANKNKSTKLIDQIPAAFPTNLVNYQKIYPHIDNGKRAETSHVNEQLPLSGGLGLDNRNGNTRKLSYEERARIRLATMKAQSKPYSSGSEINKKSQEKHNYDKFNLSSSQGINQSQMQNMVAGSSNPIYIRRPTQLQAGQMNQSTFTGNTMLGPQINASTKKSPPVEQSSQSGAFCLDRSGNIIAWDNNDITGPLEQPPIAPRWVTPPLQAEQPQVMTGGETKYNVVSHDFQSFPGFFQTEQSRGREDNNLLVGQISSSTSNLFDHSDMHMRGDGVGDMHAFGGGQSKDFEEDWVAQWFKSIPEADDEFEKFLHNLQF